MSRIFMAICISDFCNGLFCLKFFIDIQFVKVFHFGDSFDGRLSAWVTWWLIYTSWILRLFLNVFRIHRLLSTDLSITWYDFNSSLSKKKAVWVAGFCGLVALTELIVILVLKVYFSNPKDPHRFTVPFLGIQTLMVLATSVLVSFLIVWSKYAARQKISWNEKFAAVTISLTCLSTIVTNGFMMYADICCLLGIETPDRFKPECFVPIVKFISYTECLAFSAILFRSKTLKKGLKNKIKSIIGGCISDHHSTDVISQISKAESTQNLLVDTDTEKRERMAALAKRRKSAY